MDEQEYTDYKGEITISCGSTIEILATQEADGYSFQNWSYKYEGNTKTSSENPITITPITDNCILTPVYKLKECTITIESNDGKKYTGYYYKGKTEPEKLSEYTTGVPIQAVYNETITLKPYKREGYHFTEWDYKPKDNVRTDENGNLIISPITTSYVITPQYEINTYSVNILKPDNINTTCKVNVKVNNTEYNNQSLPYTKSGIEHGSEVTVNVVSDIINGYECQGWGGDKSSNTTTVTIDYITKSYTIKPIYEEMIELTFIKPDDVTGFVISYTIDENENPEQIVFGDEETQIVSLPKSTNIKVKATTADTETETDIPCSGWEKDGVFTDGVIIVPETNTNILEINNLLSNTTIKPIYCYKVELHVRPDYKTGITNNHNNYNFDLVDDISLCNAIAYHGHNYDNDIYLVQNGDNSVGANDNDKKAYLSAYGSNVNEPTYQYFPSSILYKPKSNITCKAVGLDGDVDLPYNDSDDTYDIDVSCDSWWVKDGNDNYQLLSSQRTLTIDQLLSNKVIYGALLPLNKSIGVRFYYKNDSNTYEQITNGGSYSKFFKVSSNSPIENNKFLNWTTDLVDNSKFYDFSTKTNLKISDISPIGLILDVEYQHSGDVNGQVPGIKYQWTAERIQGGMGSQNVIVGTYPGTVQVPQYIQIGGANDIDDININNNNNINNNRNNNGTWITDLSNTIQTKTIKIPVVTAFSELVEPQQTQKAVPSVQYDQIWLNIYLDPIPN